MVFINFLLKYRGGCGIVKVTVVEELEQILSTEKRGILADI